MKKTNYQRWAELLACWSGAFCFLGMWFILMFVAQPEEYSAMEMAKSTGKFVLTEPGREFFYMTLVSIVVCFSCGIMMFNDKYVLQVAIVVAIHFFISLFIYKLFIAFVIGAPLVVFADPIIKGRIRERLENNVAVSNVVQNSSVKKA